MTEPDQEITLKSEPPLVSIIHEEKPAAHYHLRADNPKLGLWLSIIPLTNFVEGGINHSQNALEACIFPIGKGRGTDTFYIDNEDMAMNTQDPGFWEELRKYGERFVKLHELNLDNEEEVWKIVFPDIIEAREKREITKV